MTLTALASFGGILAAVAAIITALITRSNVTRQLVAQREMHAEMLDHQRLLEAEKDRRAMRDARLERLRSDYRAVLQTVDLGQSLIDQELTIFDLSPDTKQFRRVEAARQWEALVPEMNRAATAIALEEDSVAIEAITEEFAVLFRGYTEPDASLNPKDREQLGANKVTIEGIAGRLKLAMRNHLAVIEAAN